MDRARRRIGAVPGRRVRGPERLGEVVVGTDGKADQLVDLLGLRRQHDDVGITEGADLPADLDSVDAGQHEVQDDDVWLLGPRYLERLAPVTCGQHRPTLANQVATHEFHHGWLVVDHEDPTELLISMTPAWSTTVPNASASRLIRVRDLGTTSTRLSAAPRRTARALAHHP